MPTATPAAVRKQVAAGAPDPVYLIVGEDDAEMSQLTGELSSVVEDELRAFNLERLYANEKNVTPSSIVQAARTLPMLGDRRVVVVLRAERILKPKRRGKAAEVEEGGDEEGEEPASDLDALEAYVKSPEPGTTLVLVATDVDRQRKVYKALQKHATIVESYGLKGSRDAKVDPRDAARAAEALVKQRVAAAGQQIEPAASRLVAERAGTDITRLRADLERLMLFAAGKPKITVAGREGSRQQRDRAGRLGRHQCHRPPRCARGAASARAGARQRRRVVPDPRAAGVVCEGADDDCRPEAGAGSRRSVVPHGPGAEELGRRSAGIAGAAGRRPMRPLTSC